MFYFFNDNKSSVFAVRQFVLFYLFNLAAENIKSFFRLFDFLSAVALIGNKPTADFDERQTVFGKSIQSCNRARGAYVELFAVFFVLSQLFGAGVYDLYTR